MGICYLNMCCFYSNNGSYGRFWGTLVDGWRGAYRAMRLFHTCHKDGKRKKQQK